MLPTLVVNRSETLDMPLILYLLLAYLAVTYFWYALFVYAAVMVRTVLLLLLVLSLTSRPTGYAVVNNRHCISVFGCRFQPTEQTTLSVNSCLAV